jgi:hypothetical protein
MRENRRLASFPDSLRVKIPMLKAKIKKVKIFTVADQYLPSFEIFSGGFFCAAVFLTTNLVFIVFS